MLKFSERAKIALTRYPSTIKDRVNRLFVKIQTEKNPLIGAKKLNGAGKVWISEIPDDIYIVYEIENDTVQVYDIMSKNFVDNTLRHNLYHNVS